MNTLHNMNSVFLDRDWTRGQLNEGRIPKIT